MAHFDFVGKDHIKRGCRCQLEECSLDCSLRRKLVNKPTNADKIRAMTDETMAKWLAKSEFNHIDAVLHDLQEQANITVEYPKDETKLTEMILKWLKEEVQDGTF